MKRLYLTAAAAILSFSCTVKEERTDCPCLLTLDFDEVIDDGRYHEAVTTVGTSPDKTLEQELVLMAPYKDVGYEISVPRRMVNTSVVCGCGADRVSGESVIVGTLPVMAFALAVHCSGDKETVGVRLHKQSAVVKLQPEGFDATEEYPFEVRLNAATSALTLYDLKPCGEPFSAMFGEDLSVSIPRQAPDAVLSLDMLADGDEPVFSVDLAAKLSAAGYDWTAEDLADIVVNIDFARMACSISVLPWEDNGEYGEIDI